MIHPSKRPRNATSLYPLRRLRVLRGLLLVLTVFLFHCSSSDSHSTRAPSATEKGPRAGASDAMATPHATSPLLRDPADARKLRVLCLHGYRGSGDVLRAQMQPLANGLEPLVEFVYVDAPSLAEGDFGWWHAVRNETSGRPGDPGVGHESKHYQGWARTRDAIVSIFERQGPFDGVFGFSQGAALTSLLVGLRAPDGKPTHERPLAFDFAMMVGGFSSNDPAHAALYGAAGSFELPSLHIVGRSDFIVPSADSLALASRFTNPLVLQHEGGHVIASEPPVRDRVRSFLADLRQRRVAR
jgi:pimeloyl-ACP methyl ester carboxylesterase